MAFQVTDLVRSMEKDLGRSVNTLRVDGGMSQNNLLLEIQATALGQTVERGSVIESTGLGAAYLAMLGLGVTKSTDELAKYWNCNQKFTPDEKLTLNHETWRKAIAAAIEFSN